MEENERQSNKGLIAVFIIVIVVILALSGVIGWMLFGQDLGVPFFAPQETTAPTTEPVTEPPTTAAPTTEPQWEVPDVVGMKANEAYAALHRAGTRFEIKREYNAAVAADSVISQSPEPGTVIPDSEKVLVVISKGVDQPDTTPPATTAPTTTKKQSSGSSKGSYILEGSDKRYVSFNEVTPLSEKQMTLALNEIYARRGRRFNSSELQSYFDSQSWYKGTISPADFDESSLNTYEEANVNTILAVMTERGYR
ncbi:MAG: YARHG domain-containing protein [Ruminococcus sp.]|nr:YARHG domain-containing protein [Ruminococcus sp.]